MCFCRQSDGGASIRLLTWQLQSRDSSKRSVRFVRLALKVAMQNDRDFVNIILLYMVPCTGYSLTRTVGYEGRKDPSADVQEPSEKRFKLHFLGNCTKTLLRYIMRLFCFTK
jgi:hypothetical protein